MNINGKHPLLTIHLRLFEKPRDCRLGRLSNCIFWWSTGVSGTDEEHTDHRRQAELAVARGHAADAIPSARLRREVHSSLTLRPEPLPCYEASSIIQCTVVSVHRTCLCERWNRSDEDSLDIEHRRSSSHESRESGRWHIEGGDSSEAGGFETRSRLRERANGRFRNKRQ